MLLHPPIRDLRQFSQSDHNRIQGATYKREISLHRAEEAIAVVLWADDGRFAFIGAPTQEGGILDPILQLFVESIGSNVVCNRSERRETVP